MPGLFGFGSLKHIYFCMWVSLDVLTPSDSSFPRYQLHPCIVFVTTVLVKMLQCLHSYITSYIRMTLQFYNI